MSTLSEKHVREIKETARDIRISLIKSLVEAGSGHTAGPLGMADIFALLYHSVLRYRPKEPLWEERDLLVLSNGHICPVLYAAMAHAGFFPVEELQTLRKFGTRLQGHPHREYLPGLETSSGPLGSGLSQAVGMAIADTLNNPESDRFVYCFMSDGEHDCGQTWEAVLLAGHRKTRNLIGVVDRNHIQIDGRTEDVLLLEPFEAKYKAFGWHTQVVDGHDIQALHAAFEEAKVADSPAVIIAETTPGKGVPEFENDYRWHGSPPGKGPEDIVPREEQANIALQRLTESK